MLKIERLWHIENAREGSQFCFQVNAFRENSSQESRQEGALRCHKTFISLFWSFFAPEYHLTFKTVKTFTSILFLNLKFKLDQWSTIWPGRRLRHDTSRVSWVGLQPNQFLKSNQSDQVNLCFFFDISMLFVWTNLEDCQIRKKKNKT